MGRIKTSFIKHVGKDLVEKYGEKFSTDFEKNKETVKEVVVIKSKRLRNIVAGYITALKKQQKT
jgi:small subunit ribosomal protein S17e